jgi:hypothetical protein
LSRFLETTRVYSLRVEFVVILSPANLSIKIDF